MSELEMLTHTHLGRIIGCLTFFLLGFFIVKRLAEGGPGVPTGTPKLVMAGVCTLLSLAGAVGAVMEVRAGSNAGHGRRWRPALVAAAIFLLFAWHEPAPGPGSWLTSFAGDWNVSIPRCAYTIGNTPDGSDTYSLCQPIGQGQAILATTVLLDIRRYAYNDCFLLLATGSGYCAAELGTVTTPEFRCASLYPREVAYLVPELRAPRRSLRYLSFGLAIVCIAFAAHQALSHRRRRELLRSDD